MTEKKSVPGEYQRLEDVPTTGEVHLYAGNLEIVKFQYEEGNTILRNFITESFAAIEKGRQVSCGFFNLSCRYRQRNTPLQQQARELKK